MTGSVSESACGTDSLDTHCSAQCAEYRMLLLSQRDYSKKARKKVFVDVQADFWNGDPDVDAICRMEHRPECTFDPTPFPVSANKIGPFNSQNTFITGECLANYFVMPHVGRMDDIWPSYLNVISHMPSSGCGLGSERF